MQSVANEETEYARLLQANHWHVCADCGGFWPCEEKLCADVTMTICMCKHRGEGEGA